METDMEAREKKSIHPLTAIAAISVTLFSLVGIGAITGLIPTSHSQDAAVQASKTMAPAAEPTGKAQLAEAAPPAAPASVPQAEAPKPVKHRATVKHPKPLAQAPRPAEEPVKIAKAELPVAIAQTPPPPPYQPAPVMEAPKPACQECGVIESVREIEKKGQGSGLGAAVGGVAGGVLGHQTGGGRGKDVMTVLGAIGGAFAGHEIEKNAKKVKSYEIDVRLDDGSTRVVTQDVVPAWRMGDRVKLVNGAIIANNVN
jgi:outer membrane lipoprotein SlyB